MPPGRAAAFARGGLGHASIKAFVAEHAGLFGHGPELLDQAAIQREFTTRHNGLHTVIWQQSLEGIKVDEGVFIGQETSRGELVAVSSLLMADPAAAADRGTPEMEARRGAPTLPATQAMLMAGEQVGEAFALGDLVALGGVVGADRLQRFRAGRAPGETQVHLTWLPLDEASLRLCWEVRISSRAGGERYRVLIDAVTGDVLVRQRLTIYLSDVTYQVFTGDSPAPFSPGWPTPNSNQPPVVARSRVTLAALNTNASPLGWIADGENETRGNNVDAHTDADGDDQPDLPRPQGSPFRVFSPPLDLNLAPAASADAGVVQLFYWCNWTHDRLYELGFDETSGNFQKDNLGRGGLGADAIIADAQDGSGVNNANFTPSPDGEPGRIQMFVWSGPDPDRDGDLDAEVIVHEYVHGLSTRLVGGGTGISTVQAAGLGEGWSDFYALALLSEPGDDPDGVYAFGAYASTQLAGLAESYYYGIRRYPYCTDLGKNPLTFKDIDPTQASPHDGVDVNPTNPFNPLNAPEVHAQGEVWCATLWDARANLIHRLGAEAGNRLILQLATDGMKLSPPNPDFLQARDAILLADQVNNGGIHQPDLWRAFAKRGLGFSAVSPDSSTTTGIREAFDLPDSFFLLTASGLFSSGPPGGPFAPACQSYSVTNLSTKPIRWTAACPVTWVQIAPSNGTLAAGQTVVITACLNSNASRLPVGTYASSLALANLESGVTQSRPVELRVMVYRGLPFTEDFEGGEIQDFWSITGTGRHRAQVTPLNGPHAGNYHLVLDAESGIRSRNEITLGLDLAGYTNVVLQFWAKSFGDEPDPPPAGPIIGGADFDGVAISEDGVRWHEVASLRNLPPDYAEQTIDLDAAIANFGLHYNPSFRIRFNQVDDFQVPFDGIGLDDIQITGVPAWRLFVRAPSNSTEGSGVLPNAGSVELAVPPSQDVAVVLASSQPARLQVPGSVVIQAGATNVTFPITVPENTLLDGTEQVQISATASGHAPGQATVEVVDNETATLRVGLPARAREGDGLLRGAGVVTLNARPVRDVSITLTSSLPDVVAVPRTVTLPAGRKSAEFDLMIFDDQRIDGPRRVTVGASVAHWVPGADAMTIGDNDDPAVTLELPPAIGENQGTNSHLAAIKLSGLLPTNLVVSLTSSDPTELRVPTTVEIPAGQLRAGFDLIAVDDELVDGTRTVRVTARAAGFTSGSSALLVLDDETPSALYQPSPAHGSTNVALSVQLRWGTGQGEALINGGFETGDFTGWVTTNAGFGAWYLADAKYDPEGPDAPGPPLSGEHHVMTAQNGAGWHLLYQDAFIPLDAATVTFSWTDRIHNYADYFAWPNQEFRVEVRDTNNVVLSTLFRTQAGDTNLQPATRREFDLSAFRGRTVRLAFVQQDNLGYLNVAIDDVSLELGAAGTPTEFAVYLGTSAALRSTDLQGTTTNGFWSPPRLALNSTYFWQIVARRGGSVVKGRVWRFTTRAIGEVKRFDFGPIASPQQAGQRFAVTVTARDDIGNAVPTFRGPLQLTALAGTGTRSQVAITEVDVGPNDQVEFANVSRDELDLSGWSISLFDAVSWPNPLTRFVVPLGTRCAAGQHFVLNDSGTEPGDFPSFNARTNVSWSSAAIGNPVAVLLQDSQGGIVDFFAAGDARPELISNPRPIPATEWSGPSVVPTGIANSAFTLQRQGQVDTDSDRDWVVAESSYGFRNPGLRLPFPTRGTLEIVPATLTNFTTGVWVGFVTAPVPIDQMILSARDPSGHLGASAPFSVGARDDVAVQLVASPRLTIIGDSVTYQVAVTNSGTNAIAGLVLTNTLPPEVRFMSVRTFNGACSNVDATVICGLDPIGPGDRARVTIETLSVETGLAIGQAFVTRPEGDLFPENNGTSVETTITGPAIASSGIFLTEGSTTTNVARFNVQLSAPCRLPVRVNYATSNITAQAGLDYIQTQGTLVFSPGITNLTVSVPIIPDRMDEASEQFALVLDRPVRGVVVVPPLRCRITDDDPPPNLTLTDVAVTEGRYGDTQEAVFRLQLSGPSALSVRVNYATVDDTAQAPLDYRAISGAVQFPAGATNQLVRVLVRGDLRYEPDEQFFLRLSQPEACVLIRTQAVCRIIDDDASEVNTYEWSPVPGPQFAGLPFAATLTARDGLGRLATNYAGAVALSAVAEGREVFVGNGTNVRTSPLGTFFHDQRTQVLIPREDLGGPGTLNAMTLDVTRAPGQMLSNWSIRIKTTAVRTATPSWESNGWSTVYTRDELILESGPVTFFLEKPFAYDGTNSLWVDFSFNNASYSTDGLVRSTDSGQPRSLTFQTDSAFGDPLGWTGILPPPKVTTWVPNLRLQFERPLTTRPSSPLPLVHGAWMGSVAVEDPGSSVVLRANDGAGRASDSQAFDVLSVDDSDGDGIPDSWELAYFGALGTPDGQANSDPDGDGLTNAGEFEAGTNPLDGASGARLTRVERHGAQMRIYFPTVAGRRYSLEQRTAGLPRAWRSVAGPIAGAGAELSFEISVGPAEPAQFLRLRVER